MADTGIFCTGTEAAYKAGYGASATASAEDYTNNFIAQAESKINVLCKYNFSDNYDSLNTDVKEILKETASNFAAIYIINYDMSAIGRTEAENRVNILRDAALFNCALLRKQDRKDFINNAGT